MTEIFILKVENGASYEGCIYDYWINCMLKNKIEIQLFDYKRLDLKRFINEWICAEIQPLFVQVEKNVDLLSLKGEVIFKDEKYYFTNDNINIEVSKEEIESEKIKLNTLSQFYFGRLDIISFQESTNKSPN
jgi:hypothetical protein